MLQKCGGICRQKKIGHTGTLDPAAEGVLPVCLGKATKVCDMLTDSDKIYRTVMLLGVETDTQDTTGTILNRGDVSKITPEEVKKAVSSFVGPISQIPPMYSALKVDGKKLCDLARAGITVERKARMITIYDIVIEKIQIPRVEMTVHCSKGTYIRTLCQDIGQTLGCKAAMEKLVRIQAAGYHLEDSYKLDELQRLKEQEKLSGVICPVEDVFAQYPALYVTAQAEKMLQNGNALGAGQFENVSEIHFGQPVRVYSSSGKFSAIYRYSRQKSAFKPVKMFLEE